MPAVPTAAGARACVTRFRPACFDSYIAASAASTRVPGVGLVLKKAARYFHWSWMMPAATSCPAPAPANVAPTLESPSSCRAKKAVR